MHWAASNGQVNAIKALKEMGADISAKAGDGGTPMHWATSNGKVDAIKALQELGATVLLEVEETRSVGDVVSVSLVRNSDC